VTVWRWIETEPANGAFQMAVDQALLENPSLVQSPSFRVYTWSPPCISLGLNQNSDTVDLELCKANGVDVVRRPTGGRAVLHDREVTYAAVFPEGTGVFLHSLAEIYDLINRALLKGLRRLGIPAELEKRSLDIRNHYQSPLSASCFSASAKHEILVHGKKLVGSAQRRLASGVLQHGSILLSRGSHSLPDLLKGVKPKDRDAMRRILMDKSATLEEALGRKVSNREVVSTIRKGMAEQLHIQFEKSGMTDAEKARSGELMALCSILAITKSKIKNQNAKIHIKIQK
jgi:lipoyl(octanoyl) transferase